MYKRLMFVFLIISFVPCNVYSSKYIDNGDGTIIDKETGLMWQKYSLQSRTTLDYCEYVKTAVYNDWRTPNIKELRSIVDTTQQNITIDLSIFPDTLPSEYLSSTTNLYNNAYSHVVDFGTGRTNAWDWKYCGQNGCGYVRCVR